MDCHFLLQGIFPTQELNPGLPHCRQTLYHLSHQGMKIMATFKRSCACTATLSTHDATAGHCRPTPPLETPGHSQASLAQSLVGTLLLSPGSWCTQGFVCALQESVSPVLWNCVIKSHWPPKSNSLGFLSPFARSSGWVNYCGS